jgi:ABC-type sugar transport system substrate-binding protein
MLNRIWRVVCFGTCAGLLLLFVGCSKADKGQSANKPNDSASAKGDQPQVTIGLAFETLQTEAWVAGFEALKAECEKRGFKVLEAVADGDAGRQLDQVRSFVTRGVQGIVLVPKDAKTSVPAIKAANEAGIAIVLFNRVADRRGVKFVGIQADNLRLTRETVDFMVEQARAQGKGKLKAMLVMGDLGDTNAIGRRDGFDEAIKGHEDLIEVVSRVPSEWNQEKAQAGVVNGLQANPDISFLFTSSDFLLPSIVSALKQAGKYHKVGEPGHVILGGFDGDATAWRMLEEGYLDATGVQDMYYEAEASIQALVDLMAGEDVPELIQDPGFVITQANKDQLKSRMWGANVGK